MTTMNLALFSDREDADAAVNDLENAGFSPKQISLVMKGNAESKVVTTDPVGSAVDDAVIGGTTGGVIGGIAGLLIGIGALTIPGIGALLIGGPIAVALGATGAAATAVSAAVTGAVAGGLLGGLTGLGLPEETAEIYQNRIKEGGILLAVPVTTVGNSVDSRHILEDHDAEQIKTVTLNS